MYVRVTPTCKVYESEGTRKRARARTCVCVRSRAGRSDSGSRVGKRIAKSHWKRFLRAESESGETRAGKRIFTVAFGDDLRHEYALRR